MILDRRGRLVGFGIARENITPKHVSRLHIVAVILQVLHVQHVIAGFVFGVDRGRVERVDKVHRRVGQTIAPGQGLTPQPNDSFLTRVAKPKPVETVQNRTVTSLGNNLGEIQESAVIVRRPAEFQAVALKANQLIRRVERPAAGA